MARLVALLVLLVLLVLTASAVPAVAQDQQLAQLVARYERSKQDGIDTAVAAFVPLFADAAAKRAGTDAAVPFLSWIVRNGFVGTEAGAALDTLAASHGASLELGPVLDVVPNLATYFGDEPCTTLLTKVLDSSGPPELQAKALFARAVLAMQQIAGVDDDRLAEASRDLEMARKLSKDPVLLAAIARVPIERRGLGIGEPAPEIAGFDLDGVAFRLSDYRGKVVVLDFWGEWCGPCRAMHAQLQALVERAKDKPFALLGINSDANLARLRPQLLAEHIGWRSFWNGPGGPRAGIAGRFAVRGWPSIYVLDDKGVVRFKDLRDQRLGEAVDGLLGEMAAAPPQPK